MGARANLVLIEGGETKVFYHHWCAQYIHCELFCGPGHARSFIAAQRQIESEDEWLDETWAEGGAVLDMDRRELLWFGGEDIVHDIPLRRLCLQWMKDTWQGWTITWAHEGIAAIADRAGFPRERTFTEAWKDDLKVYVLEESRLRYAGCFATIEWEPGETRIYPLCLGRAFEHLRLGTSLVDSLPRRGGMERLAIAPTVCRAQAGCHLNLATKAMTLWQATPRASVEARLRTCWPEWTIHWQQDRFESQAERSGGVISFADHDPTELAETLRHDLLYEPKRSSAASTAQALINNGFDVRVNPATDYEVLAPMDRQEKERLVNLAYNRYFDQIQTR